MTTKSALTKEKIIYATLKLINDEGDTQNLSVRRIAKLADVSFSTINYHFQTKDNLIKESIHLSVHKVIARWIKFSESADIDPVSKLRMLIKNAGEYYAKHPHTIKVGLLNTFYKDQWDTNLYFFIDHALAPILHEISPQKSNTEIARTIEIVYLSFPNILLQSIAHPDRSSFNYFVKEEREAFIDKFIDVLLFALRS